MQYLADTHTFLWFVTGDKKISAKAKETIEDATNEIIVSIASLWEIAIKLNLRKIELSIPFETLFTESERLGIQILQITKINLQNLLALEHNHRDPFDRIIIAQALSNNFTVITKDEIFNQYNVKTLWE